METIRNSVTMVIHEHFYFKGPNSLLSPSLLLLGPRFRRALLICSLKSIRTLTFYNLRSLTCCRFGSVSHGWTQMSSHLPFFIGPVVCASLLHIPSQGGGVLCDRPACLPPHVSLNACRTVLSEELHDQG